MGPVVLPSHFLNPSSPGEPTLDESTCKFAGRHGWYYENREASAVPGPGKYTLKHEQVEIPVGTETRIGTSLRPTIESHLGVNSRQPTVGPGHYKHLTTLGGAKVTPYNSAPLYSFTTASYRLSAGKVGPTTKASYRLCRWPATGYVGAVVRVPPPPRPPRRAGVEDEYNGAEL